MKRFIVNILILLTMCSTQAFAQTLAEGDKFYAQNDFQTAAGVYEKLLKQGESSIVYYNLGNCYYRLNMPAKALLNYERAALLDPSDKDMRANIDFVEHQLLKQTSRPTQFFFVKWWKDLRSCMTLHAWTVTGITTFILFLSFLFLYLFTRTITLRKAGFFGALLFLFACCITNLFAYQQYRALTQRDAALILISGTVVRSAPTDSGTELTTLPLGLKVIVTDHTMTDWKEIEFDNGKIGWIKTESLELI